MQTYLSVSGSSVTESCEFKNTTDTDERRLITNLLDSEMLPNTAFQWLVTLLLTTEELDLS
jgi:hypothetical protein